MLVLTTWPPGSVNCTSICAGPGGHAWVLPTERRVMVLAERVTDSSATSTPAKVRIWLRATTPAVLIDSPAVVGMVDMDQMTYAGETIDDYFANLGDKLQHIHFNDRGHTVPGDADFPMKEYYDQIKAHGYEGTCSFEICDRRYYIDPDKAIDDTVAWMRANTHELD